MEPLHLMLIGLGICLFVTLIIISAFYAAKRREQLAKWAASQGLSFRRDRDHSFDEHYSEFKQLRHGSNRYAHNIMSGEWGDCQLHAFDYHYETRSRSSKGRRRTHHHHFSAIILSTPLPLQPLMIRPEGFFDKITEFFGYDDIDFESAEFSRRFYVKAEDRRWAFDVLHARTMQFLLDAPTFTIQFDRRNIMAWRTNRFKAIDFEQAIGNVTGILDRLPDYLLKQLKGK